MSICLPVPRQAQDGPHAGVLLSPGTRGLPPPPPPPTQCQSLAREPRFGRFTATLVPRGRPGVLAAKTPCVSVMILRMRAQGGLIEKESSW